MKKQPFPRCILSFAGTMLACLSLIGQPCAGSEALAQVVTYDGTDGKWAGPDHWYADVFLGVGVPALRLNFPTPPGDESVTRIYGANVELVPVQTNPLHPPDHLDVVTGDEFRISNGSLWIHGDVKLASKRVTLGGEVLFNYAAGALVSGPDALWEASGDFSVGNANDSQGTLTIQDDATVMVRGYGLFLGYGDRSTGTLNIGNYSGGTTAGHLQLTDSNGKIFFGHPTGIGGTGVVNFNQTDFFELNDPLYSMKPGSGQINQRGSGVTLLSGNNSGFSGTTRVESGTLRITGEMASPLFDIAGGTLELYTGSGVSREYGLVVANFTGGGTLLKAGLGDVGWGGKMAQFALGSGSVIDIRQGSFSGSTGGNEIWLNNRSDLRVNAGAHFWGNEGDIRVDALNDGPGGGGIIHQGYGGQGSFTFGVDNGSGAFSGVLTDGNTGAGHIGRFIKEGTGTQALTGANSFTGGLTVKGGLVQVNADTGLGAAGGALTLDGGGIRFGAAFNDLRAFTLGGSGGTLDTNGADITYAQNISGAGAFIKNGEGRLVLTGTNTQAGGTTIRRGTVVVASDANLGAAGSPVSITDGTLAFTANAGVANRALTIGSTSGDISVAAGKQVVWSGNISGSGALWMNGPGSLWLWGDGSLGSVQVNAGTLVAAGALNINNHAILQPGANLVLNVDSGDRDYAGSTTFSGSGTLTKTGAGHVHWGYLGGNVAATFALDSGSRIDVQAGTFSGSNGANENWTNNKSDLNVAAGATFHGNEGAIRVDALTGAGTVSAGWGAGGSMLFGVDNGSGTFTGTLVDGDNGAHGNFRKMGTGTQTLAGNNTYTGVTGATGGTLILAGTTKSSTFDISDASAVLEFNAAGATSNTADTWFFGVGTVRKTGAGTLGWTTGAATFSLASGSLIDVQAGTLTGGSHGNEVWTGNKSDLNVAAGATFDGVEADIRVDALSGAGTIKSGYSTQGSFTFGVDNGSGTFSGVLADSLGAGRFIKTGGGTQTLTGANTYTGGTTVSGGTLAGTTESLQGGIANNAILTFNQATNGTYAGVISGTGLLIKDGTGTVTLTGANTYTGGTNVKGGTLAGTTTSLRGNITNYAAVTFDQNTFGTYAGVVSGPGSLTKAGSGAITLSGANTYAGGTTVAAGTLQLGPGGSLQSGGALAVNGGTFDLNGRNQTVGMLSGTGGTIALGGGTLTAGNAGNTTLASTFTGTGRLTKTGSGTLELTGASTYTGGTSINSGTVRINNTAGSALGTGNVAVAGSATLAGTGNFTGSVQLNGTLSPGNSAGTLTVGALALGSGSVLNYELATPGVVGGGVNDLVNVTGGLTLDGTLNVTGLGGFGGGVYRLINYGGTLTDNTLVLGAKPGGFNYGVQTSVAGQVNLLVDPGTLQFWDGTGISGDGTIAGGTGTWSAVSNWTDSTGNLSGAWTSQNAVFSGTGGTVSLGTSPAFAGLQFTVNGYTLAGSGGNALTPTGVAAVTTDAGVSATISAPISGSGGLGKQGAGTLILTGANSYTGGTTVTAGMLQGDATSLQGNILDHASVVFNQSGSGTYTGIISGTGSLDKDGAGTLVLSGANPYSGATNVNAGTLRVNSSLGSSAVIVAGGATLGGTGSIDGAVTVQDGGSVAPGASPGTLTVGTLTLNSGSILNYELATPGVVGGGVNDLINVTGDLTLDGALNVTDVGGFGAGAYRLINYGGTLTDNGLSLGTLPGGVSTADVAVQTGVDGQVNLVYGASSPGGGSGGTSTPPSIPAVQFWNGSGTWSAGTDNWTGTNGGNAGAWGGHTAVFNGQGGTVTVAGNPGFETLQFMDNGFSLVPDAGAALVPAAAATVRVDPGITATVAVPFTGGGSLTKVDAGTLILTGASTHTGGTTVNGGVLQIGAGGPAGSVSGDIVNNAALVFNRSDAVAFNGTISGSGTLVKLGGGTLTLGGNSTFTGQTSVNAGTLSLAESSTGSAQIAAGATLAGNGTVRGALVNHGLLSPGNSPGTIAVTGDFTQAADGRYRAELASASSYDRVIVDGTAALDGTLEVVALPGFALKVGERYEVISAGGVSGRFATVLTPFANLPLALKFDALYGPTSVALALQQQSYATFAQTPNQKTMAGALDTVVAAGRGTALQNEFNSYAQAGAFAAGLNQLSPQRYDRWFGAALSGTDSLQRTLRGHLDGDPAAGRNAWAEVVRRDADFRGDADVVAATLKTDGIVAGVDQAGTGGRALGALLAYEDAKLEGGGRSRVRSFQPSLYARYAGGPWRADATAGYAWHDYAAQRAVALPGYAQLARGDTSGRHWQAGVRASYAWQQGGLSIIPSAALQYLAWRADGFTENGATDANLRIGSQHGRSVASRLGVRFALRMTAGRIALTPYLAGEWRHEFQAEARTLEAELAGTAFTTRGQRPTVDGWSVAAGLTAALRDDLSLDLGIHREGDTAVSAATEIKVGLNCRF